MSWHIHSFVSSGLGRCWWECWMRFFQNVDWFLTIRKIRMEKFHSWWRRLQEGNWKGGRKGILAGLLACVFSSISSHFSNQSWIWILFIGVPSSLERLRKSIFPLAQSAAALPASASRNDIFAVLTLWKLLPGMVPTFAWVGRFLWPFPEMTDLEIFMWSSMPSNGYICFSWLDAFGGWFWSTIVSCSYTCMRWTEFYPMMFVWVSLLNSLFITLFDFLL